MAKIGIIANPYSKLNKRNPDRLTYMEQVVDSNADFIVTKSLDDLDLKIKYMSESNYDTIAICGGDGSISQALSSVVRHYPVDKLPRIAVLRGGTMNLVASQMKIYGRQMGVLKRFIKQIRRSEEFSTKKLATLEIDGMIGFLYADGSGVRILKEFYRKKSGLVGAAWLAVKLVSSFLVKGALIKKMIRAQSIRFNSDAGSERLHSIAGFAGTISKLPLGFPLLPHAQKREGYFQANFITASAEKLLWQLPSIMLKHKEGKSSEKYSVCCRELELECSEETLEYTLDGELFESDKALQINMGPAIEFIKL